MKKEYTKPTTMSLSLETAPIMITVSAETGNAGVGNKPVGGNTPDLTKRDKGEWGNLWK